MLIISQFQTYFTAHSNSTVVAIVVVVLAVALVAAVGGWFLYAYKNPGSKSGIWLIEVSRFDPRTKLFLVTKCSPTRSQIEAVSEGPFP